ncbi:hypothetical protein FVE85_3148 [Porphyridium purpureum]|uniref:Nucleoplasmin-like domain-containing protein n=1 Tax=Porphyridium purpureum TaxID=35688 RepID=A0A5J4YWS8_PORPP|nr:hypothetical protein FVE85_3148 [Porphyridium purpureum]|eukprot:POR5469..scf227_4
MKILSDEKGAAGSAAENGRVGGSAGKEDGETSASGQRLWRLTDCVAAEVFGELARRPGGARVREAAQMALAMLGSGCSLKDVACTAHAMQSHVRTGESDAEIYSKWNSVAHVLARVTPVLDSLPDVFAQRKRPYEYVNAGSHSLVDRVVEVVVGPFVDAPHIFRGRAVTDLGTFKAENRKSVDEKLAAIPSSVPEVADLRKGLSELRNQLLSDSVICEISDTLQTSDVPEPLGSDTHAGAANAKSEPDSSPQTNPDQGTNENAGALNANSSRPGESGWEIRWDMSPEAEDMVATAADEGSCFFRCCCKPDREEAIELAPGMTLSLRVASYGEELAPQSEGSRSAVSVYCQFLDVKTFVCVLRPVTMESVNLDVDLAGPGFFVFRTSGPNEVYLTGELRCEDDHQHGSYSDEEDDYDSDGSDGSGGLIQDYDDESEDDGSAQCNHRRHRSDTAHHGHGCEFDTEDFYCDECGAELDSDGECEECMMYASEYEHYDRGPCSCANCNRRSRPGHGRRFNSERDRDGCSARPIRMPLPLTAAPHQQSGVAPSAPVPLPRATIEVLPETPVDSQKQAGRAGASSRPVTPRKDRPDPKKGPGSSSKVLASPASTPSRPAGEPRTGKNVHGENAKSPGTSKAGVISRSGGSAANKGASASGSKPTPIEASGSSQTRDKGKSGKARVSASDRQSLARQDRHGAAGSSRTGTPTSAPPRDVARAGNAARSRGGRENVPIQTPGDSRNTPGANTEEAPSAAKKSDNAQNTRSKDLKGKGPAKRKRENDDPPGPSGSGSKKRH